MVFNVLIVRKNKPAKLQEILPHAIFLFYLFCDPVKYYLLLMALPCDGKASEEDHLTGTGRRALLMKLTGKG